MRAISTKINVFTGSSNYFDVIQLKNFKTVNVEDVFLMFLPNFSMDTPFHYLLMNCNFNLFNNIAEEFERNFQIFNELLEDGELIDKIIDMFIFILENKLSFPKEALKNTYCHLYFDGNHFGYDYDDSDFDEEDSDFEDDDAFIQKLTKKKFSTTGSTTRKNMFFISKLLKKVNDKIQSSIKFSNNTNFNVFK